MMEWLTLISVILFGACATWREVVFLKRNRFIFDRIFLMLSVLILLAMQLSAFDVFFTDLKRFRLVESALLGFIYIFYFNLIIRRLMRTREYSLKIQTTQKRLLYKLPLVGSLLGITFYNYRGDQGINLFIITLFIFFLILYAKFINKCIKNFYSLIFIALNIIAIGVRVMCQQRISEGCVLIGNVFLAASVLLILTVYGVKGEEICSEVN